MLIEMLIYLLKYKPANRKSEKKIFTLFLGIPFWRIWMVYTHSFCICQCTVWWMLNWKLENDYVVLSSIGRFGCFGAVDCIVISTVWLSFLASFAELPHSIFRMLCRIHSFISHQRPSNAMGRESIWKYADCIHAKTNAHMHHDNRLKISSLARESESER